MKKNFKQGGARSHSGEDLARMTQRQFGVLDEEIKEFRREIKNELAVLHSDVNAGFGEVSGTLKTILTELRAVREDVVELHDLRSRIERIEKKIALRA